MKIMKKILYFILVLLGLFCSLIVVCAIRPDVTDRIRAFLYPDQRRTIRAEIGSSPVYDPAFEMEKTDEIENREEVNTESERQGIREKWVSADPG